MLKYTHDKDECNLEFSGNLLDILAEVTYLIKRVHNALEEKEPKLAEEFKRLLIKTVSDENSPLWLDGKRAAENLIEKIRKKFGIE